MIFNTPNKLKIMHMIFNTPNPYPRDEGGYTPILGQIRARPGGPEKYYVTPGGPGGTNLPTRRRGALLINVFSGGENTGPSAVFSYRLPKNSRSAHPGGGVPGIPGKFPGREGACPGGPGGPRGGSGGPPPSPRTRLNFGPKIAVAASLLHDQGEWRQAPTCAL